MSFPLSRFLRYPFLLALMLCGLGMGIGAAPAQTEAPPPDKIDQLIGLLSDPEVKAWLAAQEARAARPPAEAGEGMGVMAPAELSSALDLWRKHIREMAAAVPTLRAQFGRAWTILELEFEQEGIAGIVVLILGLVAVGFGLTWAVFRLTPDYREWLKTMPRSTPQGRLRNLGARLGYAAILIVTFVIGTAGVFLVFRWPPLLREIVLGYLSVAILTWSAMTAARAFLVPPGLGFPQSHQIRVFPMSDARAQHWLVWTGINVFWLTATIVTFALMGTFGLDTMGRYALSIPVSFVQLLLMLAAVWLRPRAAPAEDRQQARLGHKGWSWLLTAYFTLLWAVQLIGAFKLFWLLVAAVVLPWMIFMTHRGVHYLLRAPDAETDAKPIQPVVVATTDRAIRMALIVAGAFFLAKVWGLDVESMTSGDTMVNRLLRGLLNAAIIVLAADFAWSVIKALIARRLDQLPAAEAGEHGELGEHDPKQARLRTLLPIFQNMLLATIVVITLLMVLSSMGIEIGPLIAGAGVAGVAIGFGAQTLVKDVISGVFYLLDDAFRVGEYIQSGSYKGTVEGFSLRSVRLRHHRGYVYTVPFGELGAVQNMSRDWVIDKFSITVDYSTDVDKARKIVKRIGQEFAENPEYAPYIIEPMKMQGVQNFGDFGIELRIKMMTKPGQQFAVRRKAYVAIKKAFEENGIKIPFPTVMVREGESPAAAAAHLHDKMKAEAAQAQAAAS